MSLTSPLIDPSLATKKKKSTIISEGSQKPRSDKTKHYVDNEKMYAALVDYTAAVKVADEAGVKHPRVSNYIGECFMKICSRLASVYQFCNYTYKDEMTDRAIEACLRKVLSFNPEKSANPFSYFTQTAYYSFLNTLEVEKQQTYIRYKAMTDRMATDGYDLAQEDVHEIQQVETENEDFSLEHIQTFVDAYEKKKFKKKVVLVADGVVIEVDEFPLAELFVEGE